MIEKLFYNMAVELRILSGIIHKIAREDIERRLTALKIHLNGMQVGIMRMIKHEEQTISELSRKFMVDPSTLVPVVDALERKQYIIRGKDPNDRRRNPLSLTAAGNALLASLHTIDNNDPMAHCLHEMGQQDAEQLIHLLREFIQHAPEGEAMLCDVSERIQMYRKEHEADTSPDQQPPVK